MKVIVQTRFSFLGKSGWQSEVSRHAELLFDEERLHRRFAVFENLTLPSLKAQIDDDFQFHILSSALMPKQFQDRLVDTVTSELGQERTLITFEPPKNAGRYFRKYIWGQYQEGDHYAQTVLDDDDAFSMDFIKLCRTASEHHVAHLAESDYAILSFPRGYQFFPMEISELKFEEWRERWINLGLTWISTTKPEKNALMTRHKVVNRHHPVKTYFGKTPVYIRTCHIDNDSEKTLAELRKENSLSLAQLDQERFGYITDERIQAIVEGLSLLSTKTKKRKAAAKKAS